MLKVFLYIDYDNNYTLGAYTGTFLYILFKADSSMEFDEHLKEHEVFRYRNFKHNNDSQT